MLKGLDIQEQVQLFIQCSQSHEELDPGSPSLKQTRSRILGDVDAVVGAAVGVGHSGARLTNC
jgi:hypothetical protein